MRVAITVDTQLANEIAGSNMDVDAVLIKPIALDIFHQFIEKAAVYNNLSVTE